VLKDNRFLIYGGGLFASAALTIATIPSDAVICVDDRTMCAPPMVAMGDKPSGNEPQPLSGARGVVVYSASAGTVSMPHSATIMIKVN
jgi:hypothetical protein